MPRGKAQYYDKRQIIKMDLVDPGDYTEEVLLCINRFAWMVARAFLIKQGHWRTTYAMAYTDNYYETPDDMEMDTIQAAIDSFLEKGDMSCDIVEALNAIALKMDLLIEKSCGPGCGGSGGAGQEDSPPNPFEDTGTNYPPDFDDRTQWEIWKCGLARLIIKRLMADFEWLKGIAITEVTATLLAATLMTPIALDDLTVLVGVLIAYGVEEALDALIDEILLALGIDEEALVCLLYNAVSATDAEARLGDWATSVLTGRAAFIFEFFNTIANMNQLFEEVNALLPDEPCDCEVECSDGWDWETEGSLLGFYIYDSTGTVSLDMSDGGLTAMQSGAGFSEIEVRGPAGMGYEIQPGDIARLDSKLVGGSTTLYVYFVMTDLTEAYILSSGTQLPYPRQYHNLDLTPWAGKTIDFLHIRNADAGSGSRTFTGYSCCII